MKFLQNFYNILFVFFIPVLVFNQNIIAQYNELGLPYIQNINIKSFGYHNKNHAIIQNKAGVLYLCNKNGIIRYDGTNWQLVSTEKFIDIAYKNDTLFVSSYNNFGIITKNEYNQSIYQPLIEAKESDLGKIIGILIYDDRVFLSSEKKISLWKENKLKIIETVNNPTLFKVNNNLYLHTQEKGLMLFSNEKFDQIPKTNYFINKNIAFILPFEDKLLIKLEQNDHFITYNNGKISTFFTEADKFLKKNILSAAIKYNDSNFALGTKKNGIALIDKKGKIISYINRQNNLAENCIQKFYIDHSNNLWVLHPNGLSRIINSSPTTYFNEKECLGNINTLIRHKNNIYLGTSLGIFKLDQKQNFTCAINKKFQPISGIDSECKDFFFTQNRTFALTEKGIYEITMRKNNLMLKLSGSDYHGTLKENQLIISNFNNFGVLEFDGINWFKSQNYIFPYRIKELTGTNDTLIWIISNKNELFRIPLPALSKKNINYNDYKIIKGLPENYTWCFIKKTFNGLIFICSKGIWRYDNLSEEFFKDKLIPVNFDRNSWIYPITEDINKNLWLNIYSEKENLNKLLFCQFNGIGKAYTINPITFNQKNNFNPTYIYPEINGPIWITGNKGIIRLDLNKKKKIQSSFHTLIRQIKVNNDSIIFYNDGYLTKQSSIPQLDYNKNTLRFEFGSIDFDSRNHKLFQYKLIGFNDSWSEWNKNYFKEYTNLPNGIYKFVVHSKNIYGDISKSAEFEFEILNAFYKSWWAYTIYSLFVLTLILIISKLRINYLINQKIKLDAIISKKTKDITIQKQKSDNLLAKVLPKETADELLDTGKVSTKKFKIVTVLFSDIQGFTKISDELNPEILIDELDKFFFHFDSVVEKYDIEKIKTIGDAYMCAGGIPKKNKTNPIEVVLAAIEMREYMKTIQKERGDKNIWGLRIGIDTGPVIAGVVGRKKLSYDIWGSTVNTASRMESSGEVDKINITGNTFMLINEFFICQYRGKMPIKNKGEIDMYFVEGIRPKLSIDLNGIEPNYNLKIQLQLLRLSDLEELILNKLEEGLPENLYYHNLKHTVDVYTQVELIGKSENVTEEELLILRTAALFHDLGHTIDFDTHEEMSVKLAWEILPGFQYTNKQINKISELIMATKMPPNPNNLLEKIICDADLDYLGRVDFIPVSNNLFKELYERNKISSETEWNKLQIKFIQSHQYFTKTARKLRDVNKNKQLENIRKLVDND